jgi:hypothetical protein
MEGVLVYKDLGDCIYRHASGLPAGDPKKLRDRKALVLVQRHVSSTLLPMVVIHQTCTAKAAWDELKATYENSLTEQGHPREKLMTLTKEKSACMEEYIHRAQHVRLQLHSLIEPVSDQRLQRAILR